MFEKNRLISKSVLLVAISATLLLESARAQFVPGRIFTAGGSDAHCKVYRDGFVYETDPENGTYRLFASLPPDSCPSLVSIAMSPDGKRLRVAALNWGAIVEFDAQGNWEIVIDGSDGVIPQATWNSITYDREGNFYVSGRGNVKVMRFPADGGPPEPLAYYNNNGVILTDAYSLSVSPSGEVYVADAEKIFLISADGTVSLFDTLPGLNAFIYSVLVDEAGYVHARGGGYWHRYELGDPSSRDVLADCDGFGQDICGGLFLSPDRTRIYTERFDWFSEESTLISVNPHDGSYETVMGGVGRTFAVVPLRGDVDGDNDTDVVDMEWLSACMEGPGIDVLPACDLADMDADGDVDLFDARYFMLGYTAYAAND